MKYLIVSLLFLVGCGAAQETPLNPNTRPKFCFKHISGNEVCAVTMNYCVEVENRTELETDILTPCRAIW